MRLGKTRYESKYLAIQFFYTEKKWSIHWMCRQLRITRAAYYKWQHRCVPQSERENEQLAEIIREYDERFGHILGYRRMTSWMNHFNGTNYSKNRIHRIMKSIQIHSVIRKKSKKYEHSTPERTVENLLKRDFTSSRPNEKWSTDVTEFKWYEGAQVRKLYLSAILDLYDRSVVSFVISRRNNNRLVVQTFDKAVASNPDAQPMFHRDRGGFSIQAQLSVQSCDSRRWCSPCHESGTVLTMIPQRDSGES